MQGWSGRRPELAASASAGWPVVAKRMQRLDRDEETNPCGLVSRRTKRASYFLNRLPGGMCIASSCPPSTSSPLIE
jgi:hypothetical protein